MRTARIVTNRRCNQNCAFCTERSAVDERQAIVPSAIERRVAAAIEGGAGEIVLTGGEPTLRRDLPAIVERARALGASRVVLESNGAALDRPRVGALREAGVDTFRLHVPAWGAALDRLTREEGAFAALSRALCAIVELGAPLEIATPIVRSSLPEVGALPDRIVELVEDPRAVRVLRLAVPTHAPDERELVSFEEARDAILAVDAAARRVGIATKLAAGSGPPPCVFPKRARPTHLWSLTGRAAERDDRARVAACGSCLVREQCAGIDAAQLARFGAPVVEPIGEERVRRRLALIATIEEQIAREFVTFDRARGPGRTTIDEEIVRVNFHCNQSCGFCFVSTHLPPPGHDAVVAAIDAALGRGAKVVLSGGEPTLNPRLAEYVRRGSRAGALPLQLQTNAVRLDDATLVRALVDAGLREAFVSLHAGEGAISDALTAAPGTFARTLAGVDNLSREGVAVILNFVFSAANEGAFPAFVALVARRWPTSTINVSFVAPSTDVVPRELVPRYSSVLPDLARGLSLAARSGVEVRGFESMCGIPLCLVPDEVKARVDLGEVPPGVERGEFVQPEPCARCSERSRCFGVRKGYAALHGTDELRPVAPRR